MTPELRVAPEALAAACSGAPALLVLGDAAAAPPALPGVAVWRVAPSPCGAALRLHRPGEDPAGATLPMPGVPAGVIGILAGDVRDEAARRLAACWQDGAAPPVVAAPGELPALLASALAARAAEVGQAQRSMARLREEAEALRVAMAALLQATGQEVPPPSRLSVEAEPDPAGRRIGLAAGGRWAQRLGTSLEGIAAVALHLAEAPRLAMPEGAHLAVRLIGVESGRLRGAWGPCRARPSSRRRRAAAAAAAGWRWTCPCRSARSGRPPAWRSRRRGWRPGTRWRSRWRGRRRRRAAP